MKIVLQRVRRATVSVKQEVVGQIDQGLLALLGVAQGDSISHVHMLAEKLQSLRIFSDDAGKMNRSIQDIQGSVLVVSQFTLLADTDHGRRPNFKQAAAPGEAKILYEAFITQLRFHELHVETGVFGAEMVVSLENDGPVTLILDSMQNDRHPQ